MTDHKPPPAVEAIGRLEELARAATPGPWAAYHGHNAARWFIMGHHYGPDIDPSDIAEMRNDGRSANAAFIAAANPQAILSLIESLRHSVEREAVAEVAAGRVAHLE